MEQLPSTEELQQNGDIEETKELGLDHQESFETKKKKILSEGKKVLKKDHLDPNMVVAIRVRPMLPKETQRKDLDIVVVQQKLLIVMDPIVLEAEYSGKKTDVLHRNKEHRYYFDRIFKNQDQTQVYERTCRSLVSPVMKGINACVFAYGTTGSGKTYTMVGTDANPGIMVLFLDDMFLKIKEDQANEYDLKVSYVQIYNEIIRDLLVPNSKDTFLDLRDDPIKGVTIAGVTEQRVFQRKEVMNLLSQGNRRRTTEATNANQHSSRSHAIFQVMLTSKDRTKNTDVSMLCGKLSLIDLAGSERGTVTENRGIRLREGAKINTSLLALANCINALGDKNKKGTYVPYRDSKLTRLLKDSLGGNCKTVMIANISPIAGQYEQTVNTLKYANRAKNIKTRVMPNKKMVYLHISAYKNIITDLRDEIEKLKAQLKNAVTARPEELPPSYMAKQVAVLEPEPSESDSMGEIPDYQKRRLIEIANEEQAQIKLTYAQEISDLFDQITQIEQGLIELDEQNMANDMEQRKRAGRIIILEQQLEELKDNKAKKKELDSCSGLMHKAKEKIKMLREATEENLSRRGEMKKELGELYQQMSRMRQEIPKRIKSRDICDYLELLIKYNLVEMHNYQLVLNVNLRMRTIEDLQTVINHQQAMMIKSNAFNMFELKKGEKSFRVDLMGLEEGKEESDQNLDDGDDQEEEDDEEVDGTEEEVLAATGQLDANIVQEESKLMNSIIEVQDMVKKAADNAKEAVKKALDGKKKGPTSSNGPLQQQSLKKGGPGQSGSGAHSSSTKMLPKVQPDKRKSGEGALGLMVGGVKIQAKKKK